MKRKDRSFPVCLSRPFSQEMTHLKAKHEARSQEPFKITHHLPPLDTQAENTVTPPYFFVLNIMKKKRFELFLYNIKASLYTRKAFRTAMNLHFHLLIKLSL